MPEASRKYAGLTALVVDDDPAARLLLGRMLEKLGFEVEAAVDGRSALEATVRQGFDLVITDLSMPGMNGLEFMRQARDRGLTAPVIFLTATGSVPKAVEAMKSGAFEFLEKPLRADRIGEIVQAAMASRGQEPGAISRPVRGEQLVQTARERPGGKDTVEAEVDSGVQTASGQETVDAGTVGALGGCSRDGDTLLSIPADDGRRGAIRTGAGANLADSSPATIDPGGRRASRGTMAGRRIGRYEVLDRIGRGGMGTVFRCRDPLLGRTVAVKVLDRLGEVPEHEQEMTARFRREAAAAANLAHPNIVAVYDLGYDEGCGEWFIVMELLRGRGLGVRLREPGGLPDLEIVVLGCQLADALAYAHAKGVIHRDLKPSNVLIQDDGSAKLLDFGLAAVEGWDVTLSGRVFGSPSYMAPERIRGESGGAPADQFSLGVVLYETVAGKNPFDAETPEARLRRVLDEHPPPVAEIRPSVPMPLSQTIERMMAKDEVDRFPTMDEVVSSFLQLGRESGLDLKRHHPTPDQ